MDDVFNNSSIKLEPEMVICHNNDDVELALDPFADPNDLMCSIKQEYIEPKFEEFDPNEVQLVQMHIKHDEHETNDESDHDDFDYGNNFPADSNDDDDDDFIPFMDSEQPEQKSDIVFPVPETDFSIKNIDEIKTEKDQNTEFVVPEVPEVKVTQVKNSIESTSTKSEVKSTGAKSNGKKKGRPKCQEQHQCTYCDKQYEYASQLKIHTRTHLSDKGHNCPVENCQKSFARADHCRQHINNVHKGELIDGVIRKPAFEQKCEICDKIFYHSGNLRKHMVLHSGERPFSCDECGRTFVLSQHLKSHMKLVHSDEKNFQCSICGRLFNHSGNYKKHQKVHSGERPFKCFCGKAFGQSSNYHAHMRVHLNDRPFKCDECDKSFVQAINLTLHKRVHTGGGYSSFDSSKLQVLAFNQKINHSFIPYFHRETVQV